MKKRLPIIIAIFALFLIGAFTVFKMVDPFYTFASGDVTRICQVAEDFDWEKYQNDPAMEAMTLSMEFERNISSRHTKKFLKAFATVDAKQRWEIFLSFPGTRTNSLDNCQKLKAYFEREIE